MSVEWLVEVKGLKKHFPLREGLFGRTTGQLRAVDDVSFGIRKGTIFGLVGESGSGKTTVGRTLLGPGAGCAQPASAARDAPEDAIGVSGSLQLAEPEDAYWRCDW